jgi:hypothetical protein
MREGGWKIEWGNDVAGKTLGIIGCGRIGMAVARRASGFAMRLLAYNRTPKPEAEKYGVTFVSLHELLAQSDFISIHAALTPETRGMIGEAEFRKMKPGVFLINTARGALVDETALLRLSSKADRGSWVSLSPGRYRLTVRCERRHLLLSRRGSVRDRQARQYGGEAIVDLMEVADQMFEPAGIRSLLNPDSRHWR